MKSLPKLLLLLTFPILLFSVSCSKQEKPNLMRETIIEEMPPYTETGANTFACKINGKPWVAQVEFLDTKMGGWYSEVQKSFSMYGNIHWKEIDESISFETFHNVTKQGDYIIGGENGTTAYYRKDYKNNAGIEFFSDSIHIGKLNIKKLDTLNGIYSGTFYFDAVSKDGETVHITEGQFDFKYPR